jgi:hypothetical protein
MNIRAFSSLAVACLTCFAAAGFEKSAAASQIGQTISSQFDAASFQNYLDNSLYTHLGMSRGLNGAHHDLCRNNIVNTFKSFGLSVELDPFPFSGQTYFNVIATKTGTVFPDAQYIVGAHYDSTNNPGADDDASGVAAMLEIARVLSQYDTAYTIKFCAWDREEQGKIGSTAYVAEHSGDDIKAMVQLDMIAHNAGQNRENVYGNAATLPLKQQLIAAALEYGDGINVVDVGNATFSDHAPFAAAGYQAVVFVEHNYITNTCYHQACDAIETPNYIHYAFASNLGRSVAGYLADKAQAYVAGDATRDGNVDVDDLLAVINSWGDCAIPCPPTCDADLAPTPVSGDCVVNVDDLLSVINNWG